MALQQELFPESQKPWALPLALSPTSRKALAKSLSQAGFNSFTPKIQAYAKFSLWSQGALAL